MNLSSQRKMAASVLGVGSSRVWIDPEEADEVAQAVTREDIRGLIEEGHIRKKRGQGQSRGRARRSSERRRKRMGTGHGRRSGAKGARDPSKRRWVNRVRAQRKFLRERRDAEDIDRSTYRRFYRLSKGGAYPDVHHLRNALVAEGHLEEE
ncbi:MAG: 50S ribosomal protein L19e [Methanonatronarchaeales archaeon]|nr:50S ribosomal protein L19e [Methanonatronarchaeales archaeon]